MKVNTSETSFQWCNINFNTEEQEPNSVEKRIRNSLTTSFRAENLLIFLGAGASKAITLDDGSRPPIVSDIFLKLESQIPDFKKIKTEVLKEPSNDFEQILSKAITYLKVHPEDESVAIFVSKCKELIVSDLSFHRKIKDSSSYEGLLRSLAFRPSKTRTKIFSLNYDLAIEHTASKLGLTVIDGFSFNFPHLFNPIYFDYDVTKLYENEYRPIQSVIHLYKLHGSLNWRVEKDNVLREAANTREPHLIFPTKEKFQTSYVQPFLEMITRFKDNLRKRSTTLLIVGYSCGDEHINSILKNSLDINFDLNIVFVDPQIQTNDKFQPFLPTAATPDARISFFECKMEEFIKLLPRSFGPSKEEQFINKLLKAVEAADA